MATTAAQASPDTIDIEDALDNIVGRLQVIARTLHEDCGEPVAADDKTYALFEILLEAIETEAAKTKEQSKELEARRTPRLSVMDGGGENGGA